MKTKYYSVIPFVFVMIAFVVISTLSGCVTDEPTISKEEEVTAKLISSSWNVSSVLVDGVDKSSIYPNLKLSFTSTGFTSLNGGVVWPASGTWIFSSPEATAILRNDGMVVTIQDVTESSLKLALTWGKTTIGPGRVGSLSGQHVFSFGK